MFFKFCDAYARFLSFLIMVLGVMLLFAVGMQVAGRYVWFIPLYLWPQEMTNFALIWSIFIGSILGVRDGKHFMVDVFGIGGRTVNPKLNYALRVLYYVTLAAMTFVFIYYGWQFFVKWGLIQESEITGISLGWQYFSVPFAGVSWLLFMIEGIIKEFFMTSTSEGRA